MNLFYLPNFSRGSYCVWFRNFMYFRLTLVGSGVLIAFEPITMFLALGFGLGAMINDIDGQSYIEFLTPGLIVGSGMITSWFECTYGTFTKYYRQRTFHNMMLTPINSDDVVVGEIMWGVTKGMLSSLCVAIVAMILGYISPLYLLFALPVIFINTWLFAAFGLLLCTYAKNFDYFTYTYSAFVLPMYMVSGVYFPLSRMPELLQQVVMVIPLTHSVQVIRESLLGRVSSNYFLTLAVLILLAAITTNLASVRLRKRLIN